MTARFAYLGHETVGKVVAAALGEAGWERVDDVATADVALTFFTNSSALEDAYFDTEGLVKSARKGMLLIDLSPASPAFARELSAVATVNDLRFVEAPIVVHDPSREDAFAAENVECFIAGDDDGALDEAEKIVGAFSGIVTRAGACGMAQLARAACTAQIAAQVMSAVEAAALYGAAGTEAQLASAPGCTPLAALVLAGIDALRFEGDYTVEMMMGDVVAAMTAADDSTLILPQMEAIMHLLEVLAVIGGADMAPTALVLLYRDEQASADQGLDWTRAEGLFEDGVHDHHGHAHGDDYEYDDSGYDGYDGFGEGGDPFGYAGGFGGYSAN